MMKRTVLVVAFAFLSLLQTRSAFPQQCTLPAETTSTVRLYAEAVRLYRQGQPNAAAARLDSLDGNRFDQFLELLRRNGWADSCILAAALLHTEVGMRSAGELEEERARAELDRAWKLTELVPSERVRRTFQRNWFLLVSLYYQKLMFDPEVLNRAPTEVLSLASVLFERAQFHFEKAIEAFPADHVILLAAGTLFEWAGAPKLGEPGHLRRAEQLYERSCRANTNDPVSQLRYGTVLFKRERFEDARAPLLRVMELPSDDETIFRAHMALGRLAEREERYAEAMTHYREAMELKPDWQIVYVALSYCLHETGNRSESRRVLFQALHLPWTDDNLFGWWSYETGLVDRMGALLEDMRKEVSS